MKNRLLLVFKGCGIDTKRIITINLRIAQYTALLENLFYKLPYVKFDLIHFVREKTNQLTVWWSDIME